MPNHLYMDFDSAELEYPKPKGVIRIASFDIAKINFAHYVDDTPISLLKRLENRYKALPKKFRRRVKGRINLQIEEILRDLYRGGKRVHMGVYNLRANPESKGLDTPTRRNLLQHLRNFERLWDTCDFIVIEQQYFKTFPRGRRRAGSEANVDAIKIGESVFTWFLDNYLCKEILYFGSQFKTQMLGAPPGLNDSQRKKWAIEKSLEIHQLRKDQDVIDLHDLKERVKRKRMTSEEKIRSFTQDFDNRPKDIQRIANQTVRNKQKFDDFSDACAQAQAFKYRTMIACF